MLYRPIHLPTTFSIVDQIILFACLLVLFSCISFLCGRCRDYGRRHVSNGVVAVSSRLRSFCNPRIGWSGARGCYINSLGTEYITASVGCYRVARGEFSAAGPRYSLLETHLPSTADFPEITVQLVSLASVLVPEKSLSNQCEK